MTQGPGLIPGLPFFPDSPRFHGYEKQAVISGWDFSIHFSRGKKKSLHDED